MRRLSDCALFEPGRPLTLVMLLPPLPVPPLPVCLFRRFLVRCLVSPTHLAITMVEVRRSIRVIWRARADAGRAAHGGCGPGQPVVKAPAARVFDVWRTW